MAGIAELIRTEVDGGISFGNYELAQKGKRSDFEYAGDLYKVKTFKDITKLEKNGMFTYESVPGTTVTGFKQLTDGVCFHVEGTGDSQIIVGVEDGADYSISINAVTIQDYESNLKGKLVFSVDLSDSKCADIRIKKQ